MKLTCYRDAEVARVQSLLNAATYNLALTLLSRNHDAPLFIPIRAMQYLAILDTEEIVFIDGERKCWVDIAWQHFRPQLRSSLAEPVAFEAVYYQLNSSKLMPRLHAELPRALNYLASKDYYKGDAQIFKFPLP